MSHKISLRSFVIVPIQPEIPSILRDHLSFPLPLLLVLLDPLILINVVHEPTYTPNWFPGQRFSQVMLSGQANLEIPYSYIIKIPIYLVEHLPIPIEVRFQSLYHGQQRVQRPRSLAASHKIGPKCPSKLLKGIDKAFFQAVKPPHRHKPQTRWEHLAH